MLITDTNIMDGETATTQETTFLSALPDCAFRNSDRTLVSNK
jgi:hypothetical protein